MGCALWCGPGQQPPRFEQPGIRNQLLGCRMCGRLDAVWMMKAGDVLWTVTSKINIGSEDRE